MSKATDGWRDVRSRNAIQVFSGADHEQLTEISALLCGQANSVGTGWDRPPLTLCVYLDGDLVKFCFSSKDFDRTLWGSCQSLHDGFLAIEEALCRGHFEWKQAKKYDNGFTHVRK